MTTSEGVSGLAAALAAAQGQFTSIPKNKVNPFFNSKYADLSDVIAAVRSVLAANGLAVSQFPSGTHDAPTLRTILFHESGEYVAYEMPMYLPKNDSQGQGSALTYARRYALCSVLGISADDDDDGNRSTVARTEEDVKADESYREAMAKAKELRDAEGNGHYTSELRARAAEAGYETVPAWAKAAPYDVYAAAEEYLTIVGEIKAQEAQAEPVTPAPAKRTRKRAAVGSAVEPDPVEQAIDSLRGAFGEVTVGDEPAPDSPG